MAGLPGLWNRLTSGIFGVGVGIAAADAMEPIIEPATSMMESSKPRPWRKWGSAAAAGVSCFSIGMSLALTIAAGAALVTALVVALLAPRHVTEATSRAGAAPGVR